MNPRSLNACQVLALASELDTALVDKLAHALGWPTSYGLAHGDRLGRVKWANPYRNYYAGSVTDPEWNRAAGLGLGKISSLPREGFPYTTWTVTAFGRQVIRLRLEAARWAYKARQRAPAFKQPPPPPPTPPRAR